MKKLLFVSLLFLSVNVFSQSTIKLVVENSMSDTVVAYNTSTEEKDTVVGIVTGSTCEFIIKPTIDSITRIYISGVTSPEGDEYVNVFITPNGNLTVTVNTDSIDESLVFSGDDSPINEYNKFRYLNREEFEQGFNVRGYKSSDEMISTINSKFEVVITTDSLYNTKFNKRLFGFDVERFRDYYLRKYESLNLSLNIDTINIINEDSNSVSLNSLIDTTKPTIVYHTSTWCGPCKAELPYYNGMVDEYSDKFNFVTITVWSRKEKWNGEQYNGVSVFNQSRDNSFIITGVPMFTLIDNEGNVVNNDVDRPSLDGFRETLNGYLNVN